MDKLETWMRQIEERLAELEQPMAGNQCSCHGVVHFFDGRPCVAQPPPVPSSPTQEPHGDPVVVPPCVICGSVDIVCRCVKNRAHDSEDAVEAKIEEILNAEREWLRDRLDYRLRELVALARKR